MRPVVDGAAMRLIEDRAMAQGQTVEGLMDAVGLQLADCIMGLLRQSDPASCVVLLGGKGNNGADGYTALELLRRKNVNCLAWQVHPPSPNSLLDRRSQSFVQHGGRIINYPEVPHVSGPLLIVDGLYGAGFKGKPDAASAKAILWANSQRGPVISIDLPSGVDPTTGEVRGEAIYADYTMACHLPKQGCFFGQGWEHTGSLVMASLPLETKGTDICMLEPEDILHLLPRKHRTQNKFQAGSVVAIAGSPGMMGAASLSSESAYLVGAGYVRLLLSKELGNEIGVVPREVVKTFLPTTVDAYAPWLERADSVFIGPGLGRAQETMAHLDALWPRLTMPTVVDADALFWLSTRPEASWHIGGKILTPHFGEASRLFQRQISGIDEALVRHLQAAAVATGSIIVLKGAPTLIFASGHPVLIMPRGDPGMATAGTGDVLTGVIAGLLAQKLPLASAAMLGTWLHGVSGEEAARLYTSYGMTASAVLRAIPTAMAQLLHQVAHGMPCRYVPFGRAEVSEPPVPGSSEV